jgi:hypothetical protein
MRMWEVRGVYICTDIGLSSRRVLSCSSPCTAPARLVRERVIVRHVW